MKRYQYNVSPVYGIGYLNMAGYMLRPETYLLCTVLEQMQPEVTGWWWPTTI